MGLEEHILSKHQVNWQGSLVILFSIVFFDNSFTNIVTITFSSLIMIELLNVYTAVSDSINCR